MDCFALLAMTKPSRLGSSPLKLIVFLVDTELSLRGAKRRSNPALGQQFVLPSASALQLQIPVLAHHRSAPALVRLAAHELEAGLLIDVAGCGQHAVSP